MRKIPFFITVIATLAGLSSCQKVEFTQNSADSSREIVVEGEIVGADAKTKGLALVALPDWRNTQEDYIHIFEDGIEGTSPKMEISSSNNRIAYFSATFDSIFEGKDDVYHTYTAVIAPRQGDVYSVPAVQYPDDISLIDPAADFLIGGPKMAYTQDQYTKFKIDFVRPVSVFRLCFVNLPKGEKIQEIVLNADTPLTGEVVMDDIFFERGLALFDMADGSKSITLKYNDAEPQTIFYAYFVCCPTSTKISSIVVKTDRNTYTKQTSASIKFTSTVFQSIAVDMNNNTEPETEKKEEQTLSFTPSSLSFEIGGTETFTEPSLTGAMTSPVSYFSKNPSVADVDATTGKVTFKEAGEVEICAVSPEDDTYYPGFASYTVTVTKAPVVPEDPEDPEVGTFYKASTVETGYDYVIVSEGMALANVSGAVSAEAVTVSGSTITVTGPAGKLWKVVSEIDPDLLQYGKYHLTNGGKYLSRISGGTSGSNLEIHDAADDAIATKMKYTMWDNDATNFWNISIYQGGSPSTYYAYISSGAWVINTNKPSVNVAFYTSRQPQDGISFSESSLSYDIAVGGTITAPMLQNAHGTVTYSSSNPSVVEVNATTGVITPKAVGTAVITATAAGDESYQGASVSYTVTVSNSQSDDLVLTRATAVKDGGMYIMVNNGKALQNNSGAFGAVTANMDNEHTTITFDKDTNLDNFVWTWTSSSLNKEYGDYTITNGSDYLYVTGSYSEGYEGHIGNYGTTDVKYVVWRYKSNQVQNGSDNAQRYLTYDDGWKVPSSASSHDTYLFEYVDPRTPQTLTFAQAAPSIDLASSTTYKQEVSGAQTAVTYSISATPSDAATIAADGTVTATKKGTAVITATAAASATYQAASASYTLTINNNAAVAVKFYKVTPSDIAVGNSYLIVSNGKALKNNDGSVAAVDVTDVSGVIELDDYDALVWTAGTPTYTETDYPGYTYTNGGKMLNRNSGNIQLASASNDKYYNFAYAEDGTSGKYTFMCGTHYYTGYDSGWKAPTNIVYVTLYCSEKPKTSRNLAFAEESVSKKIGDASFTNALSGVTTGVTYSSSNTAVATVNASTGAVTIGTTAGTTTITATAAADATYAAGTASYVLTVSDPNVKNYVKVTDSSISEGTYLLVYYSSNSKKYYAFSAAGSSDGYRESISIEDDKIASDATIDNLAVKVIKGSSDGTYYFETSEGYLYTKSGDSPNIAFAKSLDEKYAHEVTISSGSMTMKNKADRSSSYYLVYNSGSGTSSSTFKYSSTSGNLSLYLLEDSAK